MINSSISNGQAILGGAIYANEQTAITIQNSTLTNLTSFKGGGGIHSLGAPLVSLAQATFTNNSGVSGAVYLTKNVNITNCTFTQNIATGSGGMKNEKKKNEILIFKIYFIFVFSLSRFLGAVQIDIVKAEAQQFINITNSIFEGNTANVSGGGLAINSALPTLAFITEVSFTNNQAGSLGGTHQRNIITKGEKFYRCMNRNDSSTC